MRKDGSLRKARSAAKPLCWEAPGEQAHGHGRGQHRRGRAWQLGSRRAAEPGAVAAGRAWYGACGLRGLLIAGEGHGRGLRPGERCGSWCCGGEEGARARVAALAQPQWCIMTKQRPLPASPPAPCRRAGRGTALSLPLVTACAPGGDALLEGERDAMRLIRRRPPGTATEI